MFKKGGFGPFFCFGILLTGYLTLLPLVAGLGNGSPHDVARWMQLLILPFGTTTALFHSRLNPGVRIARPALIAGLLAAATLVAAPETGVAAREFLLLVSLGVLAVLYSGAQLSGLSYTGLVGGQAAYAGMVLLALVAGLVVERTVNYWYLSLGFDNIRFLNHVQTVSTPLLLVVLGHTQIRRSVRLLAGFAAVFALFMTSLLQARATTVAFVVIGILAPLLFGRPGWTFSRRLCLAAVAGVLLHVFVMVGLPLWLGIDLPPAYRAYGEASSIESRLFLLRTTWADIAAHPWLGIGPMHFAHYFNGEAAHPHNIYAQVAAEYGLPFAGLLLLLLGRALWRAWRLIRQQLPNDMIAIGSFLACLGALVDGCFSGNFVMPMSQMWIMLAAALLLSRLRTVQQRRSSLSGWKIGTWPQRVGLVLLLVAQLWLIVVSWPEMRQANPVIALPGHPSDFEHYSPRFWHDGWF